MPVCLSLSGFEQGFLYQIAVYGLDLGETHATVALLLSVTLRDCAS